MLLALACARSPEPATTTTPAKTEPAPPVMSDTGVLDEAAFKKLHELRADAAPPAKGIEIDLAGTRAYLSLPEHAKAPLPAVVVIHEWWGLNEHIRHWTDRLAADGYAALAVDLYGGEVATDPDGAMKLMKAVDEARAQEILAAAHRFLRDEPRVAARKRAVIGWCFGGAWSLRHAIAQPDLDAAIIYYGRLVTDEAQLGKIHAELLGVFADRDQGIPPGAVQAFVDALGRAGKTIELHRYDAEHAFANPSGAHYEEKAAADAWAHVRAFLRRTLQ
jgi:carboxymethylenebutenolidase